MSSITKKLTDGLSKLHNKEAEQTKLLTNEILIYKIGESTIVGDEVVNLVNGRYRLSSSKLNQSKKEITPQYFSFLQSALTYSVAQQRGWMEICLQVIDYDQRLGNAELDIILFNDRLKNPTVRKNIEKAEIYYARLSSARLKSAAYKAKLQILSKKAKYRMK